MPKATPSLLSVILPPIAAGLAYAAAKSLGRGEGWGGLYWQSPFMFSALAGLLMAVALRPVLERVPWSRGMAFAVALGLFLLLGPVAAWSEARLAAALGLMGFPYALARDALPELLAAWVAAGLLAWLYRPRGGEITFADMAPRVRRRGKGLLARIAALGLAAAAVAVALGLLDGLITRSLPGQPIFPAQPWLRASLSWAEPSPGDGAPGALGLAATGALLAVSWLRGMALALALLPIALVLRGRRAQMALVFTILPFVIGDFAPLMESQPFPSQAWLMLRVGLSGLGAVAVGSAAAWLIALAPPEGPPPG